MQLNSAFAAASRCCGCSHSCRLLFYCHDWPHNIGYGLQLFVRFYGFKLEPVPKRPKLISVVDWALVSTSEATVSVSQLGGPGGGREHEWQLFETEKSVTSELLHASDRKGCA